MRDIFTHRSGIGYVALPPGPAGYGWYTADRPEPICATVDRLATVPLSQQWDAAWV